MKKLILIITFLSSLNTFSQERAKFFFRDFVECYYSKKVNESILIYENPKGKKIAELSQLTEKYCWYKFAISESKNGWLKIENILSVPGCEDSDFNTNGNFEKYKGKWVLAKNMIINIGVSQLVKIDCIVDKTDKSFEVVGSKFYNKPSVKSQIAFCVSGYVETELIETHGTWAKLKIIHKGKTYIGWLQRKYQCAYPWTTCPVYD